MIGDDQSGSGRYGRFDFRKVESEIAADVIRLIIRPAAYECFAVVAKRPISPAYASEEHTASESGVLWP